MTDGWTLTLRPADVADALSLADKFNNVATTAEKVAAVLTHATAKLAKNIPDLVDKNGALIVKRHCPSSGESYEDAVFHALQAEDLVTRDHPHSSGDEMRVMLAAKTVEQLRSIRKAFRLKTSHGAARLALRVAKLVAAEKRNPGKHEEKPVKLVPDFKGPIAS